MARGDGDLAHTHSTQDGRIAHRVTQRNFSFGDKEFGVTLPLFKCLPGNTRMTAIFRHTSVQVKLMTCRKTLHFPQEDSTEVNENCKSGIGKKLHIRIPPTALSPGPLIIRPNT